MRGKILVALAPVILGGCAQQMLRASQNDCAAFGYTPGTDAYASCIQQRFGARQRAFQAGLANMSRQAAPKATPRYGTAFLRSQYVSGTSRICTYDRMGSPFVMTVGAADLCPISVP